MVDLLTDPHERNNIMELHGWLQFKAVQMISDFRKSLAMYPPVPMGAPDDYQPPK
jgi:arylsulfatase